MRCSCHVCDTYMNQSEGLELGCVCPNCGYRCKACLGTDSVISRESFRKLREDKAALADLLLMVDSDAADFDDDCGYDAPRDADEDRCQWDD